MEGWGGRDAEDWRLPNFKELNSIVERACYDPAINIAYFPNTPGSYFWSASPYAIIRLTNAWVVNFNSGFIGGNSRNDSHHVRLVRGGQ